MATRETGSTSKQMIRVLKVLRMHSSPEHRLTLDQIADYIFEDCGTRPDRKAVSRCIDYLEEEGFEVEKGRSGNCIYPEFENAELQLLIDSVMYSRVLTKDQAESLVKKLEKHTSYGFSHRCSYRLDELFHGGNKSTMRNIETITEAIDKGKKIKFKYKDYGIDKKLHYRRDEFYIVNPYYLVTRNGWYYLVGNYDEYENISNYRVDRMSDVEIIVESKVKPKSEIKPVGFDLPRHMAEHIYMFSGKSRKFMLKAEKSMINDFIDWFGDGIEIKESPDGNAYIWLDCDEDAMKYWVIQFGQYVEVMEPVDFREKIGDIVQGMSDKYNK